MVSSRWDSRLARLARLEAHAAPVAPLGATDVTAPSARTVALATPERRAEVLAILLDVSAVRIDEGQFLVRTGDGGWALYHAA